MKFNFKFLLVLIAVIPIGVSAFSLSSSSPIMTSNRDLALPYIVEEVAPSGQVLNSFAGTTAQREPFAIATDLEAKPFVEDRFSAFPDITLGIGSKITLYRAPSFTIFDGKKEIVARSWAETVEGVVTDAKILQLGEDDKINFALTTEAEPNMEIRITRVAITSVIEKEAIDYKVVKKDDNTLDQGKTKVAKKGVAGVRTLTYTVRREDGVQISKVLSKNEVTTAPTEEILMVGTKPVIIGWCKYNDIVLAASIKNGLDPNRLCDLMRKESRGNVDSVGAGKYYGLFQYDPGFWASASAKAGFAGASITDAKAQIYTTAWAVTHGYAGRWGGTFK